MVLKKCQTMEPNQLRKQIINPNDSFVKASYDGNLDEVKRILDTKSIEDIDVQHSDNDLNLHGESTLSAACRMERVDVVTYLLSQTEAAVLDLNIINRTPNAKDGYTTPMISACKAENVTIVNSLLKTGKIDCQFEDQFKKSALS